MKKLWVVIFCSILNYTQLDPYKVALETKAYLVPLIQNCDDYNYLGHDFNLSIITEGLIECRKRSFVMSKQRAIQESINLVSLMVSECVIRSNKD